MKLFEKISGFIDMLCNAASTAILIAMTIMYFSAIVSRYIVGSGFRGSEEFTRYGMIWMIYIGSVLITKDNGHLNVSVLENMLSAKYRRYLLLAQRLLMIAYLSVMVYVSLQMVEIGRLQTSPNMDIPMNIVYGIFPVSFTLMVVQLAFISVRDMLGSRGGDRPQAEG